MEESPKDIIELEVIPPDSKIHISLDTEIYVRIQKCLMEGLSFKDFEHFRKCVKEVIDGKLEDPLSEHAYTLLLLCNIIEEAAKKDNLVVKKKFDLKSSKIVDEAPPA